MAYLFARLAVVVPSGFSMALNPLLFNIAMKSALLMGGFGSSVGAHAMGM
jgi:hypothetical protein